MPEDVLIIKNDLLPHIQTKECCLITEDKDRIFDTILKNQLFMLRDEAEYNFEYKQVIPYVTVRHKNDYLLLQRTSQQLLRLTGAYRYHVISRRLTKVLPVLNTCEASWTINSRTAGWNSVWIQRLITC